MWTLVWLLRVPFTSLLAGERLVSSVNHHVDFKVSVFNEMFSTLLAGERLSTV